MPIAEYLLIFLCQITQYVEFCPEVHNVFNFMFCMQKVPSDPYNTSNRENYVEAYGTSWTAAWAIYPICKDHE